MIINIKKIEPATWNYRKPCKESYLKLLTSIKKHGQLRPIIVRRIDGRYRCVEGRQILKACAELGVTKIDAKEVNTNSTDEAIININLNDITFPIDYVALSFIIADIYQKKTAEQLITILPMTAEDIKDFLDLSNFAWENFAPKENNQHAIDFGAQPVKEPEAPAKEKEPVTIQPAVKKPVESKENTYLTLF